MDIFTNLFSVFLLLNFNCCLYVLFALNKLFQLVFLVNHVHCSLENYFVDNFTAAMNHIPQLQILCQKSTPPRSVRPTKFHALCQCVRICSHGSCSTASRPKKFYAKIHAPKVCKNHQNGVTCPRIPCIVPMCLNLLLTIPLQP